MKKCKTLQGLLNAIEQKQDAILTYTHKSYNKKDTWIIYLTNGTNLIVTNDTYETIKNHLVQKG